MSAKKIGKPLGGVGAENMQKRKFNLVLDDRLLSKQYVKERILDNTSNEAYGSDWANEDEKAPTKQSIFNQTIKIFILYTQKPIRINNQRLLAHGMLGSRIRGSIPGAVF